VESEAPQPWQLRTPRLLWGGIGLAVVLVTGLALLQVFLMAVIGQNQIYVAPLLVPVLAATGLTGFEIRSGLRHGRLNNVKSIALRGARGWGAVGLAWPLAWGLGGLFQGDTVMFQAQLLPAIVGAGVGAAIGAISSMVAARLVLRRP
jgi:hypothetical protein